MSKERNIYIDAVAKLVQLTHSNVIKWRLHDPLSGMNMVTSTVFSTDSAVTPDAPGRIGATFEATHKGRRLRIGRTNINSEFTVNMNAGMAGELLSGPSVRLEIIDQYGRSLWTFPRVNPLFDLMKAVEFQVADINGFINELLHE